MVSRSTSECAPHNLDAERSVLGACLLHADAVRAVATILEPQHFYLPRHQIIFRAILATYEAKGATDPIVVGEELARTKRLEDAGGHEQLLDLLDGVVTAAGVDYHAEIVLDHARRRHFIGLAREINDQAAQGADADGIAAIVDQRLREAIARPAVQAARTPSTIIEQWGRDRSST